MLIAQKFFMTRLPIKRIGHVFSVLYLLIFLGASPTLAQEKTIIALGDSLTAGYGLASGLGFVPRLEAALRARGHKVKIINAGVSGDTSAGGLSRLDWTLAGAPTAQAVIVELGANDALRGLNPRLTQQNLAAIITRLQAKGLAVLLAGMQAPPNLGQDYHQRFTPIYPRLAAQYGVEFYPFFLKGVAAQPHLNLADGIHPNAQGIEIIVSNILPTLERLLKEINIK